MSALTICAYQDSANVASGVTWRVDRPCVSSSTPCEIEEVTHHGIPTGHLMCAPHGEVVGEVTGT